MSSTQQSFVPGAEPLEQRIVPGAVAKPAMPEISHVGEATIRSPMQVDYSAGQEITVRQQAPRADLSALFGAGGNAPLINDSLHASVDPIPLFPPRKDEKK